MRIKNYLMIVAFGIAYMNAFAQAPAEATRSTKKIIYMLPDGSILEDGKMDSLLNAWGRGRVAMAHDKEDDKNGIVHLVRITDEVIQANKAKDDKINEVFKTMLNQPAPDFTLTDLQGKQWSLKELRGKIVILNFWFTSCAPCIQEMPELNKLVEQYKNKNVVFLALTFNDSEQVKIFLQKRKFDYKLLPGSDEVDKKYQVSSWPASFVIDQKGYIKMIARFDPKIREKVEAAITSLQ